MQDGLHQHGLHQNLISIQQQPIDGEPVQTVNARELHAFLGVGAQFKDWIQRRIQQHGLVENQDFVCCSILSSKGRGGHNAKDYHFTVNVAKHVSMAEHTEKGKEARDYFIECERRLRVGERTIPKPDVATPCRLHLPNLLHGFPKGTTLKRITVMERKLVGQGVHDFGLKPETARIRALEIMRESLGADPAFLFRGLPIIVPEKPKKKAVLMKPVDALSVDRTARPANDQTASSGSADTAEAMFCGAQELAGMIPIVGSTGQPDGHRINEALIAMGFAQRRSDNGVFPRQPQADGLYQLAPVVSRDGHKLVGRFFTVWNVARILPILRQYFNEKPQQLQLVPTT